MRAQLAALLATASLPTAGGLGLLVAWIYAIERSNPTVGMAFLVVGVVALAWMAWLRRPVS